MKLIAPDYYPHFKCIADKCRHSCCIGWEIGIDPEARQRYRAMTDFFGRRINTSIEDRADGSVFRMGADGRCPMLNESGLCDLITQKGEGALCQICADHPRFRNFYQDRTEIGLGLCCEAAAMLILGQERPVHLVTLEDDGIPDAPDGEEGELLAFREACIAIMQDRGYPVDIRLELLLERVGSCHPLTPDAHWVDVHRDLERLDPAWDDVLDTLGGEWDELPHLSAAFEQFAVYLLHRHLPGALADGDVAGRVRLVALSTRLLMAICHAHSQRHGDCTLADCAGYARMWSAEIEYDDESIDVLLDALWEE